jgi:DNA-binding transcriptional MerR regulator
MPGKQKNNLLKMSELVKRTGVQKETIRYYISEGLLPAPLKTGKNMAYYDESYIERIEHIKELQLKYFLPLKIIKEIVVQSHPEMTLGERALIRDHMKEFMQLQDSQRKYAPMTLKELSRNTGMSKDEIIEMEKCEMISSRTGEDGTKVYLDRDIKVVEAFAGIRKGGLRKEFGFTVDQFRMQSDVISTLAKEEVKDFLRKLSSQLSLEYDKEFIAQLGENAIERVNEFIVQLRRKMILDFIQELVDGQTKGIERFSSTRREGREILVQKKVKEVIQGGKNSR